LTHASERLNELGLNVPEGEFLLSTRDDASDLSYFLGLLDVSHRGEPDACLRKMAHESMRKLLARGLIQAGSTNDDGRFVTWQGAAQEIVHRVEREWRKLGGRMPRMYEVAWFRLTPAGDALVDMHLRTLADELFPDPDS